MHRRQPRSATLQQPITEEVVEVGDRVNFLTRGLDGISHPTKTHRRRPGVLLEDHVAAPHVIVSRLADRPDVDHRLALGKLPPPFDVSGGDVRGFKVRVRREDPGNMRMPLKAVAFHQFEDVLHFQRVVDVLGKHVFVERPPRRSVDVLKNSVGVRPRKLTKKIG
jgi:hypothetical protein